MPHAQPNYEISDEEIRKYFFTVHEVSDMLKCTESHVRRFFQGRMIWHEGRWMISPSDIQLAREHT